MRIIRYTHKKDAPRYGWIFDDRVGPIEGSPFEEFRRTEAEIPLEEVQLLAPTLPSKIICVGRNYVAHAAEHDAEVPEVPLVFLKPPSSLVGPNDIIYLPPQSQQVEHEGELAVVIGKRARWVDPEAALDFVLGYTVGNDVTARDLQRRDGQWTRGKGFDSFCPLGPWIETDFDPTDALVTVHVNDELRQMASTRDMVFTVRQLLAYVTSVMTLEPGDVLLTGTPAGVGPLQAGDSVEVVVEGLGTLTNPVETEPAR
ncbi:MAG: FAA hydrolase family protein [Chloroflexi bacterium]|nr:MAG: FAA hydrolase family protein [Chloroflexota bacterium]MBL1195809.1 FAA hydrolase family protein [Chloroflexota bacterium]NOH13101.1 fumarylacetoacetate hydrolase family protein [Chloroflexota bacterium]